MHYIRIHTDKNTHTYARSISKKKLGNPHDQVGLACFGSWGLTLLTVLRCISKKYGKAYYFNAQLKKSQYDRPS